MLMTASLAYSESATKSTTVAWLHVSTANSQYHWLLVLLLLVCFMLDLLPQVCWEKFCR
jgi:hypothetical protein